MLSSKFCGLFISLWIVTGITQAQIDVDFTPIPPSYDINSPNPLYALDINYDDIDLNRQAFHIFLPDTTGTYPLVVFIHGGGFTGGSRDVVLQDPKRIADIKYFLERGVAFASVGYRVLPTVGADEDGVIKCLNDSKRALQFIRHFSDDLHIIPERVAMIGTSAGSGTGLWLATHPDMAEPDSPDPVLRASTRVCAAAPTGGQATYDIYKWETEVFANFDGQGSNFTLDSMEAILGFERLSNFYGGLDSIYQIVHDPFLIQYRQDVDMLFHMSDDDPPLYIVNASNAIHPSQDLFHHSFHGREIYNQALAAGIEEVVAEIQALDINTTQGESRNEFILRQLSNCSLSTSAEIVNAVDENELIVFPNPVRHQLNVRVSPYPIERLELYTITGQAVRSQLLGRNSLTTSLNLTDIPQGTYMLLVVDENGYRQVKRIVIE
ncbi:MAG: T9SS type A sorting domain-containing protein [Bacteroidota bacterium]